MRDEIRLEADLPLQGVSLLKYGDTELKKYEGNPIREKLPRAPGRDGINWMNGGTDEKGQGNETSDRRNRKNAI